MKANTSSFTAPSSPLSQVAAFVAIDWADQGHVVALQEAGASQPQLSKLEQSPQALIQWIAQLRRRFGGRPVAIIVEQKRGALIHALLGHEFLWLYPVNPRMLAQLRSAIRLSGAKDDPVLQAPKKGCFHRRFRSQFSFRKEFSNRSSVLVSGRLACRSRNSASNFARYSGRIVRRRDSAPRASVAIIFICGFIISIFWVDTSPIFDHLSSLPALFALAAKPFLPSSLHEQVPIRHRNCCNLGLACVPPCQ